MTQPMSTSQEEVKYHVCLFSLVPLVRLYSANTSDVSPQIHQRPLSERPPPTASYLLPPPPITVCLLSSQHLANPHFGLKTAFIVLNPTPYSATVHHSHSFKYKFSGLDQLFNPCHQGQDQCPDSELVPQDVSGLVLRDSGSHLPIRRQPCHVSAAP